MRRMRDEAGAVAIFVALSISTFLLGFAALAVDLGQVYTRKADLQTIADSAALAGASKLPDVDAAAAEAVHTICAQSDQVPSWDRAALGCNSLDSTPVPAWAVYDGNLGDGGLVFYDGDPGLDKTYDSTNEVPYSATEATAMRVLLPGDAIDFGLAAALGARGVTVSEAATARIGTALGAGLLPFPITTKDLEQDNTWCVRDPDVSGGPATGYPGAGPSWLSAPFISVRPNEIGRGDVGREISVDLIWPLIGNFPANTVVHFAGAVVPTADVRIDRRTLRFDAPGPIPADEAEVWIEWRRGGTRYVSNLATIRVRGAATPTTCDRPEAERGYVNLDRDPVVANALDELSANISEGVDQPVHRYPEGNGGGAVPLLDGILGGPINGVVCSVLNPLLAGAGLGLLNAVVANAVTPYVNCAQIHRQGFADAMEEGLIDGDGLLTHRCSDAAMVGTRSEQIDGTDLFTADSPLVRANSGGGTALRTRIEDLDAPIEGFIKNEAFACPRLVAMPVIHSDKPQDNGEYPIVDILYGWIDDDDTGLVYQGNRLQALRGHVIDPGYFPETVTRSPVVGEYLGDYLPKQAVLVPDIGT